MSDRLNRCPRYWLVFALPLVLLALGASPATCPSADFSNTWLLHLPGIGGEMQIDHDLVNGLKDGGWGGTTSIYDWTENDPGLDALLARPRHQREAKKVAEGIVKRLKKDPSMQITLTSHSAGTGIAVWALEELPDDMQVQTLVLMASALSPRYDLSKALRHVHGKAYVLYSEFDTAVLDTGTRVFGTVDGEKTAAAGLSGFTRPDAPDKTQYAKLVQMPYDKAWMEYHNNGDHIGCMARPFVKNVLAPILIKDLAEAQATTRPSIKQTAR